MRSRIFSIQFLAFLLSSGSVACSSASFQVAPGPGGDDASTDSASNTDSANRDDSSAGDTAPGADGAPGDATGDAPGEGGFGDAISGSDAISTEGSVGCTKGSVTCDVDKFCEVPCGVLYGTCKSRPKPSNTLDPVCGCDGITYWNPATAAEAGVPIVGGGECTGSTRVKCTDTCPSGGKCIRQRATSGGCTSVSDGTCWVIPGSPDCSVSGGSRMICGSGCDSYCHALLSSSGKTFYVASCSF